MVAIFRAWYNGSYTMTAKPVKSLGLLYTMIQLLLNNIYFSLSTGTLTACFLAFSMIALVTSSPIKRRSLPCQGNNVVHSLLRDAMVLSNELARQSSVLSKEVVILTFCPLI